LQQVRAAFCAARSIAAIQIPTPTWMCLSWQKWQRRSSDGAWARGAEGDWGAALALHAGFGSPRMRALFPARCDQLVVVTIETLPPYEGWRILFDHDHLCAPARDLGKRLSRFGRACVAMVCDEFWWSVFQQCQPAQARQLWMALHLLDVCRATWPDDALATRFRPSLRALPRP